MRKLPLSIVFLVAVFTALTASALTVEKFRRDLYGCDVSLAYAVAASDRAVLVAWGPSDAGANFSSWANVSYAEGVVGAGSTSCRVALPPAALAAAYVRFFLVPDNQQIACIETDGTQYIQTDFYPGPTDTTIFADFYPKSVTPYQQRVFGTSPVAGLAVQAYINSGGGWSWSYSNAGNWTSSGIAVQTVRTQVLLDGLNNKYTLTMDGVEKKTMTISSIVAAAKRTNVSRAPLNIFATAGNVDQRGNMKLYALTCSRNGTVERDFRPYVKRGVLGVRDAVTGAFFPRTVGNMLLGAPTAGTAASETSSAVSLAAAFGPVKMTACFQSGDEAGVADIAFAAAASAREVWYAWDDADKGTSFAAWAHNERIGTVAANATFGRYRLPPGSKGFAKGRLFLLSAGGSYDCTYIRGEGRQGIDTGILAGTNVCISANFRLVTATPVQQRPFGVSDSDFTMATYINNGGNWAWAAMNHHGNWTGTTAKPRTDVRTQITLDVPHDLYTVAHDGQQVYSVVLSSVAVVATNSTRIGNRTLALMAAKTSATAFDQGCHAELYGASIQTNGVAARTFAPCVVSGEARMRDAVTGATFGNAITDGATQFIPGGRLDSPTPLAVGDAVDLNELAAGSAGDDVMADAAFWVRDFSGDLDGNGIVDDALSEGRDHLGRNNFIFRAFGPPNHRPVFTNELVRMPGRNAARQANTLYLPQPIVYTNEAQTLGYACPSTFQLRYALKDFDDHYTLIMRVRPDFTKPCYSSQWLANFAHGAGKGLMFGFLGSGAHGRRLGVYIGGSSMLGDNADNPLICTNGWCDIAMIADGRKLTCMLVRDWRQTGETTGVTLRKELAVPPARDLTPNHTDFLIGAESTTDKALPLGSTGNNMKCFRGSIAQVAVWRRALSTEEVYRALGWPRTDLWRVGVQDGKAGADLDGTRPAEGIDVDGAAWPLRDGLAARQSVTFKFPLENLYETQLPQFLRWKSVEGSAGGRLQLAVNGTTLQSLPASSGKWVNFFVPANTLVAETNTLTVTRVDGGAGAVVPDTVAFGGGWQVGKVDGGYPEYGQEWVTSRDFYAADGNWRDVSRVLQTARSANVTNLNVHFNMPAELAGLCRWRVRGAISGGVYPTSGTMPAGTLPMRVDLNGRNRLAQNVKRGDAFSFEVEAEDLSTGLNRLTFMNAAPDLGGTYYFGIDAIVLEPIRPADGTFLFMR